MTSSTRGGADARGACGADRGEGLWRGPPPFRQAEMGLAQLVAHAPCPLPTVPETGCAPTNARPCGVGSVIRNTDRGPQALLLGSGRQCTLRLQVYIQLRQRERRGWPRRDAQGRGKEQGGSGWVFLKGKRRRRAWCRLARARSPVKLNTPQSAPLGRVESARAAPDFSFFSAQFATKTLPMPRATGICAPATCSCCRPAYHCCPLPLPPPPPPRASHSAACWLWPRGPSAGVSPAGPLRRTRVSFT